MPGAQHDDVRDRVGTASVERAGEVPAATVADDRDPPSAVGPQPDDALQQPGVEARTAAVVEADSGRGRPVADGAQEAREQLQRQIRRKETRQEQHGPPVAARHATAAKGGIGEEPSKLDRPAQLPDRVHGRRRRT